jgi:hypothetical protein
MELLTHGVNDFKSNEKSTPGSPWTSSERLCQF